MLRLVELDVRSLGPMWSAVMAIRKLELRSGCLKAEINLPSLLSESERLRHAASAQPSGTFAAACPPPSSPHNHRSR
jgi:hypothetical protein